MAMATMMISRMMGMSPPPVPPPPPPPSSSSSPLATQPLSAPSSRPPTNLPTRIIPGSYGWPLLGPISDRLDYFWFQGPDTFFRSRMEKHKSTVFRTNVPPSFPFFVGVNPNVIAVVDCRSFAHLFDMEIVEKKDVLVGDFMPSVKFTGNTRVCAYLDTSEPKHAQLKNFAMDILKRSSKVWVTELLGNLDKFLDTIESEISTNGSSSYIPHLQSMLFNFLAKSILGADPTIDPDIANSAPFTLNLWLGLQLLPTISVRVIQPLEEIFLHSYTYPHALVSGGYQKLYHFIERHGQEVVQRGEIDFGLSAADAIHNLIFVLGFNAFGGFSIFLPTLFAAIASDKTGLQARLREEVRKMNGSSTRLSFDSLKEMELVNSVVYETLRLNPPVALQYARARKDFQLASHDSVFDIKEGELLCGYQPLAMRDGKVFDEPESFKPDRFVGKGKELLSNLFWSNGPQTGSPSESNKQCAGKDYVTLSASLIVAHMFQRYDSFSGDSSKITAVEKAK
ncbi:PREDICTED: fatty acid hydroperoxide lyase, chloroplastic [Theobroma cacao]|uniref:Fatty acid hydroperoxide lyase, chloroplastic n=1 Tax=Theobroma cacao TaxID=3641 RepID=A0AB32VPX4_THECC|nr:PREDICTED: fatty acid hydroperoxide lyase, chloroplastic [Theobroma cacao]